MAATKEPPKQQSLIKYDHHFDKGTYTFFLYAIISETYSLYFFSHTDVCSFMDQDIFFVDALYSITNPKRKFISIDQVKKLYHSVVFMKNTVNWNVLARFIGLSSSARLYEKIRSLRDVNVEILSLFMHLLEKISQTLWFGTFTTNDVGIMCGLAYIHCSISLVGSAKQFRQFVDYLGNIMIRHCIAKQESVIVQMMHLHDMLFFKDGTRRISNEHKKRLIEMELRCLAVCMNKVSESEATWSPFLNRFGAFMDTLSEITNFDKEPTSMYINMFSTKPCRIYDNVHKDFIRACRMMILIEEKK